MSANNIQSSNFRPWIEVQGLPPMPKAILKSPDGDMAAYNTEDMLTTRIKVMPHGINSVILEIGGKQVAVDVFRLQRVMHNALGAARRTDTFHMLMNITDDQ